MEVNTTIDLDQAEYAVSSLTNNEQQQGYQPRTLQQYTNARNNYLPLFPTKSFGPNNCLLLANVPGSYFDMYTWVINLFLLLSSSFSYSSCIT
jgi:hypothetical protein